MCTVTYVPYRQGFILTHNRDESPERSADGLLEKSGLVYPVDTRTGGTWIAATATGRVVCLLNGGKVRHVPRPPYRMSRGLLIFDAFKWKSLQEFGRVQDFVGIEPFTMLEFHGAAVQTLLWDGSDMVFDHVEVGAPRIWSSVTLYTPEVRMQREVVFRQWLSQAEATSSLPAYLLEMHRCADLEDIEQNFMMCRGQQLRTVSITQVVVMNGSSEMRFIHLETGREWTHRG
jgi:hypothetical protein